MRTPRSIEKRASEARSVVGWQGNPEWPKRPRLIEAMKPENSPEQPSAGGLPCKSPGRDD